MRLGFIWVFLSFLVGSLLTGCKEDTAALYNSAEAGNATAQYRIGKCFMYGECGLPKSYEKAEYWLLKSANRADPNAQYQLYKLYTFKDSLADIEQARQDKICLMFRKFSSECMKNNDNDSCKLEQTFWKNLHPKWLDGTEECDYKGMDKFYNKKKALYWLQPAADQGSLKAKTLLGWEILMSNVEDNEIPAISSPKTGANLITDAAKKDDINAQCLIFSLYSNDKMEKDICLKLNISSKKESCDPKGNDSYSRLARSIFTNDQAIYWLYRFSSNQNTNDVEATLNSNQTCVLSGIRFAVSMDTEGKLTKEQLKELYDNLYLKFSRDPEIRSIFDVVNFSEDLLTLGNMYYKGRGVEKNNEKAFMLFSKIAEWEPEAEYYLGEMYLKGESTPKDPKKAISLFEESAKQNMDSALALMKVYEGSPYVQRDLSEAYKWLNIAFLNNDRPICSFKRDLGAKTSPDQQEEGRKRFYAWLRTNCSREQCSIKTDVAVDELFEAGFLGGQFDFQEFIKKANHRLKQCD